ncbi:MAG: pantoate--beta-alanine ligase [Bacteroidetes bacterium]|nr:pantoate--beta-alanine ligase [Bacteroidota bacterium]
MLIIKQPSAISEEIKRLRNNGKRIGFFPTMGALHEGHLSLLEESKKTCDIHACSIFVNPTQFNNPDDLMNYPRTPEKDLGILEKAGCDIVFMPEVNDLYALEKPFQIDINDLASRYEGASRPGHFQGVCRVVKLLFDAIGPDDAFFGLKDFQQCMVIQALVDQLHLPVALHFVPTLREPDGLAMSSRNLRLNKEEREEASAIYKALSQVKASFGKKPMGLILEEARASIEQHNHLQIDYLEIAESRTLKPFRENSTQSEPVVLAAIYAGDVRLIDNLLLK